MTEQDYFDPHFTECLPDMCWPVQPDDSALILIQRGRSGYQVLENGGKDPGLNRHMANYRNQCRGITKAQEQATLNDWLTDFLEIIRQRCWFDSWFFGHYHRNEITEGKYILQWAQIVELR